MTAPLLLALSTLLALVVAPRPAPSVPFVAVTANVRFGTAGDGDNAWEMRREFCIEMLQKAAPDVLGLQEALDFQVDEIRAAFPHHVVIGEGRDGGTKGEWTALLVDTRRFTVRAAGTFRLAPKDEVGAVGWDAALTRIATWAELADGESDGRTVRVINAHFDHRGKEARLMSARLIAEWSAARAEMPTVVMGDLNAGEDSPPLTVLREAGFSDTFRAVHPEEETVGTMHAFLGLRTGAKIDYVMTKGALETENAFIDWTERDGLYPSDHRFVGARLAFTAGG